MLSLCLFAAITPVSDSIFDQTARVHADLQQAALTATSRLSGTGETVTSKYDVRYRWPGHFRLRTLHPTNGRLLRDWAIEPGRTIDYDPVLMQYTSTPRPRNSTLGSVLAELDRNLDDLVLAFTEPRGIGVWLESMTELAPWSVTANSSTVKMTFAKGDRKVVLETDRQSGRVKRIDITTGPRRLEWTLAYQSRAGTLAFSPPNGVYQVPVFDREMLPPTYKDEDAKRVAKRVFDAYDGLSSIGYKVIRETGETTVYLRGKFARQEDARAIWVYDGTTLTLFQKQTGSWFRGRLGFPDVVDAVGNLGTRVDPTLRLLMTGFNVYRKRLGDGATVGVAGTMELDGEPVTLLESASDNAKISLVVRDRDGMVLSSMTSANDEGAIATETVELRFEYFSVPQDVATRMKLTVPAGRTATKLTPKPTN